MEAYPLSWPIDYKRTPVHKRTYSRFKNTMAGARDFLKAEVKRLGGKDLIISSNVPLKQNGDLVADWPRYKIIDHGVAIYFKWKSKDIVMCCDTYTSVWENLHALAKSIENIRGLERWGVSEFIERTFTGFTALPETAQGLTWYQILECNANADVETIKRKYRELAKKYHPDVYNDNGEKFKLINATYAAAVNLKSR